MKNSNKKAIQTKNKNPKMTKKLKITFAVILSIMVFLTAGLFVVDSFAPASPQPYHRWVASTFAGSFDAEGKPNTYYQVQIQKDVSTGKAEYSCINTKISTINSKNLREVWISFSDLYEQDIEIFLSKGWEGKSGYFWEVKYTKSQVRNNKTGWFRVYNNTGSGVDINKGGFIGQLRIGFSANVKVREIVIVDVEGRVGTVSVDHCSNGPKPVKDVNDDYSAKHDNSFYPSDVDNVCDEKGLVSHEVDGVKNIFKI